MLWKADPQQSIWNQIVAVIYFDVISHLGTINSHQVKHILRRYRENLNDIRYDLYFFYLYNILKYVYLQANLMPLINVY